MGDFGLLDPCAAGRRAVGGNGLAGVNERTTMHLTVRPGSAELEAARQRMLAHLQHAAPGFSARSVYAAELVLEEWLTNVFRHAGCGQVDVALRVVEPGGDLEMRFEDDGRPFDPTAQPEPEPPRSLDEARPGGLGLVLIRRFASKFTYVRQGGRNVARVRIAGGPAH